MSLENKQNVSAFVDASDLYSKPTQAVPTPSKNIGIDTDLAFFQSIVNAGISGQLDISALESFSNVSQSRDQIYALLDTMCEDSTVSAILETYAEDGTEYADNGRIVWAESSDSDVSKYVTFLLDSMRVDKNIYAWFHSLCKYGDIYLRLYRESDYNDALFMDDATTSQENKTLNEDVKIKAYKKKDHYIHYLELVPNPANTFELTKFGKTYAYIQTSTIPTVVASDRNVKNNTFFNHYQFRRSDVIVHSAQDFVHGCLEDHSNRSPEEVQIFLDNVGSADSEDRSLTYTVRRGQSLLYNTFKIWRELTLLENSILLNRITKSAITRLIGVEVGDMPKEMVGPHLQGIKSLIEQKSAIQSGKSLNEYTNPGPIENNIYVPTKSGIGAITAQTIGGDVNVGQLTDLDHFQDKFFGAMRVPKQYFGVTDDNAGFSGGQSLSIISSRYAKMVKRIQNTMCQVITDAINLMLIDKGLDSYINKFKIRMLPPTTQEEIDRRDNLSAKVQLVSDIMNMTSDIEDPATKLKLLKTLLANVVTNTEVITLLQDEIDKLTASEADNDDDAEDLDLSSDNDSASVTSSVDQLAGDLGLSGSDNASNEFADDALGEDEVVLPSPEELGAGDLSDNNSDF